MDPASIIGTTAATLQFLGLLTKIATGTWRAFASAWDVPVSARELRDTTAQFKNMVDELNQQLQGGEAVGAQVQLRDICADCLAKARELQTATSVLADKVEGGSRLLSLWEAMKQQIGPGQLDKMAKTLADHQGQLVAITVMCLWEDSRRKERTLQQIQSHMSELHGIMVESKAPPLYRPPEDPAANTLASSNRLLQEIQWDTTRLRETRDEIMDVLIDCDWNPDPLDPDVEQESEQLRLAKRIAMSLDLTDSRRRRNDISKPYKSTFQWIWERDPEVVGTSVRRPKWSSFPKWLEAADENLYWVTGRPGSGKSTLMRFIEDHEKLREHLESWRPELPLHIWSFYAWNPGETVEKSIDGLVRSILQQALQVMPHLVPVVVPRRWAFKTTLRGAHYPGSWEVEDMERYEEGMYRLLAACRSRARLVILLDGLDEFEVAPKRLIRTIQRMSAQGSAKICVASRPWTEFLDQFRASPYLAVHEMTAGDIETYVTGSFRVSPASEERPGEVTHLQRKVIEAAEGVFQWVTVVMNFLIERLEAGESQNALLRVIDELPDDLSALYSAIWGRITHERRMQAEEIFALKHASYRGELRIVTLWAVQERHATNLALLKTTAENFQGVVKVVSRLLGSRTLGLLEIDSQGIVSYLHRTVPEWASQKLARKQSTLEEDLAIIHGLCTVGHLLPTAEAESHLTPQWTSDLLLQIVAFHMGKLAAAQPAASVNSAEQVVSWLANLERAGFHPQDYPVFGYNNVRGLQYELHPCDFTEMLACIGYEPFVRPRLLTQDQTWRDGKLFLACLHQFDSFNNRFHHPPWVPADARIRLVRLCLENGVPLSRSVLNPETCTPGEAAEEVRHMAFWAREDADKDYYKKVAEFLEKMAMSGDKPLPRSRAVPWKKLLRRRRETPEDVTTAENAATPDLVTRPGMKRVLVGLRFW